MWLLIHAAITVNPYFSQTNPPCEWLDIMKLSIKGQYKGQKCHTVKLKQLVLLVNFVLAILKLWEVISGFAVIGTVTCYDGRFPVIKCSTRHKSHNSHSMVVSNRFTTAWMASIKGQGSVVMSAWFQLEWYRIGYGQRNFARFYLRCASDGYPTLQ